MVVDTSAIIAILQGEPEASDFANALARAEQRLMSAGSYLELCIVIMDRRGAGAAHAIDAFLAGALITVVPFDETQAVIARDAFTRFGKGHHKAALNFGDCMTYALARRENLPVLFKGTDFGETDLEIVKPIGA